MRTIIVAALLLSSVAHARDDGQWELTDPHVRQWFHNLKQPDNPHVSCCSFADAYYVDQTFTRNGDNIAVITDDRDDGPLGRPHIPIGTEFAVPDSKLKYDQGNPTGRGVIFIGGGGQVLCFVMPGGV
jgi:hypothetical protein